MYTKASKCKQAAQGGFTFKQPQVLMILMISSSVGKVVEGMMTFLYSITVRKDLIPVGRTFHCGT